MNNNTPPQPPLPSPTPQRGIIAWFANNPVAANLLMALIIVTGLYAIFFQLQRTVQPELDLNMINIIVVYPGASPEEVENGVILKIEEVLQDIEGIKRIEATATQSLANVQLQIHDGFDVLVVLDEVKSAVDGISSFPEQVEKPVINKVQLRDHVVNIQVHGDLSEMEMKELIEEVKDELLQLPDVASVEIYGDREYEIAVEVPELTLRKYRLTLDDVAQAIRQSSIDLPGGSIKTGSGEIVLHTRGQAYDQYDFENVVLLTQPDGTRLTLGDIATVNDGFVEDIGFSQFDGGNSMGATVHAVGDQDLITVATAARKYVAEKKQQLPPGVYIDYWADISYYLEGRLDMMIKNLILGGLLVFIVLALFLDFKLAFWVMVGLPLCFLGAFAMMPTEFVNISLNMISLFGFILVLGIVVDDAIIIGESAYSVCERKGHSVQHVVEGALRVATPATFGVLTTIVAFSPTLFVEGVYASFPAAMGWVVVLSLTFSLIESKWILPAHLAHSRPSSGALWQHINRVQQASNKHLRRFVQQRYKPFVTRCIRHRYTTFATFLALLILTIGLVAGGIVRYVMFPDIPADFLQAELEMQEGSADWQTQQAHDQIAAALEAVNEDYKMTSGNNEGFIRHVASWGYDTRFAQFILELTKTEDRTISGDQIVEAWREAVGEVPGAKIVSISSADQMAGPAVGFKLSSRDIDQLQAAAEELALKLATYDGAFDVRNSASALQDEIHLSIRPGAQALGLSLEDLGTQVREAFYGAEAQRIQRGTNEIKVMVRYPRAERETVASLENMMIRTAQGDEVPFSSVATITIEPAYSKASRIDSQRAIAVSAQMDKTKLEPTMVAADITDNFMPELQQRYPSVQYQLDGESEETGKFFESLMGGFVLALIGIYALLAIPLKSYLQPLIIMAVIPFGIIGAIIGHALLGISFSMMSFFGVIALSGVVVNDSLIMVDFVNRAAREGMSETVAVVDAGVKRFRAIMLTSLTTFFGLLPMLLEKSAQAQIIVPMAVSLSFGILFATVITLLLVPCLYVVLADVKRRIGRGGRTDHSLT